MQVKFEKRKIAYRILTASTWTSFASFRHEISHAFQEIRFAENGSHVTQKTNQVKGLKKIMFSKKVEETVRVWKKKIKIQNVNLH